MVRRYVRTVGALCAGLLMVMQVSCARNNASAPQNGSIPFKVVSNLRERFPGAEISKWTRETEDGVLLYDIEFVQQGRKGEADIGADGTIRNWEHEVAFQDLPDAVQKTVVSRCPGARVEEVMATIEVRDRKDVPEGFEVDVTREDGSPAEITVAPDGRVIEFSEAAPADTSAHDAR